MRNFCEGEILRLLAVERAAARYARHIDTLADGCLEDWESLCLALENLQNYRATNGIRPRKQVLALIAEGYENARKTV